MRKTIAAAIFTATLATAGVLAVAQEPVARKPLQKSDFPGNEHATHIMLITVAPGATVARHTHPGIEMGYVVEGEATLVIEGQGETKLKPGDSYFVPAGAIHSARNTGTTPIKVVGTFVVEKAKPLATAVK